LRRRGCEKRVHSHKFSVISFGEETPKPSGVSFGEDKANSEEKRVGALDRESHFLAIEERALASLGMTEGEKEQTKALA